MNDLKEMKRIYLNSFIDERLDVIKANENLYNYILDYYSRYLKFNICDYGYKKGIILKSLKKCEILYIKLCFRFNDISNLIILSVNTEYSTGSGSSYGFNYNDEDLTNDKWKKDIDEIIKNNFNLKQNLVYQLSLF